MATQLKFSADINTFNVCADHCALTGYGRRHSPEESIRPATEFGRLTGVEVVGLRHVTAATLSKTKGQVTRPGIVITCETSDI